MYEVNVEKLKNWAILFKNKHYSFEIQDFTIVELSNKSVEEGKISFKQ